MIINDIVPSKLVTELTPKEYKDMVDYFDTFDKRLDDSEVKPKPKAKKKKVK